MGTVMAIAEELTVDGFVLRYRAEETDDGLSGDEGAFTMCSFWLVSALVQIGEIPRARQLCEKLLSHAQPIGPLRRGDRPTQRASSRKLSAGAHAPGAHQRGDAPHPRRASRSDRRA